MNDVADINRKIAQARQELLRSETALARQKENNFLDRLSADTFRAHVADLEHQLYLAEAEQRREIVEWHLEGPRVTRGSVPLRLLAILSDHFERAVTLGAWRLRNAIEVHTVPRDFVDFLDLRLADVQSGSARLFFTGNTAQDLTGSSLLADALTHSFALFNADVRNLTEPIAAIGLRSAHRYSEWLKALANDGVSAEIRWQDDAGEAHEWGGLPSDMARVRERISALSESPPQDETLSGEVVTLSEAGRIQIKVRGGQKITVRYPQKLYAQAQALHLGERVTLPVRHTVLRNSGTGKTIDRYALRGLTTT